MNKSIIKIFVNYLNLLKKCLTPENSQETNKVRMYNKKSNNSQYIKIFTNVLFLLL